MMRGKGSMATGGCLAIAASMAALFTVIAPYWVWARALRIGWAANQQTTVGIGAFVQSYSSNEINSMAGWSWTSYWLWNSQVSNNACLTTLQTYNNNQISNQDPYELFGQYFCDNGVYTIPTEMKLIQAFTILTCLFAFFGGLIAMKGGKAPAVLFSFIATVFSVVSFSAASSWTYMQNLRNGSAGLLIPTYGTNEYVILTVSGGYWWGSSFYIMILTFLILLAATFFIAKGPGRAAHEENLEYNPDLEQQQAQQPVVIAAKVEQPHVSVV